MGFVKKTGSNARRGSEGYGLGLARSTSFGRKRVALSDVCIEFEDSDDDCGPIMLSKRQCFQDSFLTTQKSLLEDLPQEVLIRILCGVEHSDLKRLFFVSKAVREAALIAKQSHFAYSTPQKKLMFRDAADFDDSNEIRAPNAPRVSRPRLSAKKLLDISVALFASDTEVWPRRVNSCTEMVTEI